MENYSITKDNLEALRAEFLQIERQRWNFRKRETEYAMDRFSEDSIRLSAILNAIKMLGLYKEFRIRRAGAYFKPVACFEEFAVVHRELGLEHIPYQSGRDTEAEKYGWYLDLKNNLYYKREEE